MVGESSNDEVCDVRHVLVALAVVLVAACGSDAVPSTTAPEETTTAEPDPVEMRQNLEVDGESRFYLLSVPQDLNPDRPAPLVIVLHGGPSSPERVRDASRFHEFGQDRGIVVTYPGADQGVWDLDDGEAMDREDIDDVEFVDALIDEIGETVSIDPDRVYAVGFSQGGGLAAILGSCRLTDRIAAVGQVGSLFHPDGPACPEESPVPLVSAVGTSDPTAEGVPDLPFADPPRSFSEELEAWVSTNGCSHSGDEQALDDGVTRVRHSCEGAPLVYYRFPGGHVWPHEPLDANQVIWEFLSEHS